MVDQEELLVVANLSYFHDDGGGGEDGVNDEMKAFCLTNLTGMRNRWMRLLPQMSERLLRQQLQPLREEEERLAKMTLRSLSLFD